MGIPAYPTCSSVTWCKHHSPPNRPERRVMVDPAFHPLKGRCAYHHDTSLRSNPITSHRSKPISSLYQTSTKFRRVPRHSHSLTLPLRKRTRMRITTTDPGSRHDANVHEPDPQTRMLTKLFHLPGNHPKVFPRNIFQPGSCDESAAHRCY
jgi:hypothetical protein